MLASGKGFDVNYPVAYTHLSYAVTGREINSSMLPADAGCIVDNVETICSIYDAVALGRPVSYTHLWCNGACNVVRRHKPCTKHKATTTEMGEQIIYIKAFAGSEHVDCLLYTSCVRRIIPSVSEWSSPEP